MSQKFHGHKSGKKKTEKRLLKLQEENKIKNMSSTDTMMHSTTLFANQAEKTGSAHLTLSKAGKAYVSLSMLKIFADFFYFSFIFLALFQKLICPPLFRANQVANPPHQNSIYQLLILQRKRQLVLWGKQLDSEGLVLSNLLLLLPFLLYLLYLYLDRKLRLVSPPKKENWEENRL